MAKDDILLMASMLEAAGFYLRAAALRKQAAGM
jgi:hypothetical protein